MAIHTVPQGSKRNTVLAVTAGLLLVAAGAVYFVLSGSPAEETAAATVAPDAMVTVSCANCGASWDVSEAEYAKMKDDRDSASEKLMCTKCNEKKLWRVTSFEKAGGLKGVPDDARDSAYGNEDESSEEQPKKKKTVAAPALRPGG